MGLLDSLKSYTASDKGVSLRSKDAVEEEVLQRTQALAVANSGVGGGPNSGASTSAPSTASIPRFFSPKPQPTSLKSLMQAEAKERALEDRRHELMETEQIEEVWYMLLEQVEDSEEEEKRINYDDFTQVRTRCREVYGPLCDPLFRASTFMRFPQDAHGAISVDAFFQYVLKRNQQDRVAISLAQYDSDNDGFLTVEELEAWVGEHVTSGRVQHLLRIDKYFVTQYKRISAHKFVFFHCRRGKMRIRDITTSPVMQEWLDMVHPRFPAYGPPMTNWFTLQATNRVYKLFMDLDQRMTGSLRPNEFARFSRTMTPLFVSRIFEEHAGRCRGRGGPKNAGEMLFVEFMDFLIAWECKEAAPSIAYLFTVYDLRKTGKLTGVEMYMFLMEIYKMWVDLGYYAELSIGDIKDEIFDMVKPKDPLAITLQELIECKVGGTIVTMMADVAVFWNYDNRESLMQSEEGDDE